MRILHIAAMALAYPEARESDDAFVSLCLQFSRDIPEITELQIRAALPHLRAIQLLIGD